jgi:NAD+ synthase
MKITLCQLNFTVGDFKNNTQKIIDYYHENSSSDLVVFPELCVSGYPPEDMVKRPEFVEKSLKYTNIIIAETKKSKADILINTPWIEDGGIYNAALIVSNGEIVHKQYKYDLPNYGVFDEKRVFKAGPKPKPFTYKGRKIGMLICEDTWNKSAAEGLKGAEFILSVNASPFERTKHDKRTEIVTTAVNAAKCPVFYINQICGHDDLVFDGGSFVMAKNARVFFQMKFFEEDTETFDVEEVLKSKPVGITEINQIKHIYNAMMLGLSDYVHKNNFPGVVIGLSGGMDSALTAVVAVDALGKDKVKLVFLPSKYTAKDSFEDAQKLANNLKIKLETIDIEPVYNAYAKSLDGLFTGTKKGTAEENLQSRIRGSLLMAISNKFGHLLLTTGNKSEVSTGYCTLYGDMAGGYNLLKDIYKTRVYDIAKWRNKHIPINCLGEKGEVIPQRILDKAPSAELRENQKDSDTLPPYEILDEILYNMIELEKSEEEVIAEGFPSETVKYVEKLLYNSEFKRRQSAIGVKISSKPFGRDRRYPITNKFLEH